LFAAAWMIGYVAATAEAALQSLTVASLTAQLGLAREDASGKLEHYPVFYAARALSELGGNPRHQCHSSHPGTIAAVAGMDREGRRITLLANLTGKKQEVVIEAGQQPHSALFLDEQSLLDSSSGAWREEKSASTIRLLSYAVACLRFNSF
jgi:D-apionolactonase